MAKRGRSDKPEEVSSTSSMSEEEDDSLLQKDIQFCIKCPKKKLSREKKHISCKKCKFKIAKYSESSDARARLLPLAKDLGMKHCFKCGEKVVEKDWVVSCSSKKKGCGMTFSMEESDSEDEDEESGEDEDEGEESSTLLTDKNSEEKKKVSQSKILQPPGRNQEAKKQDAKFKEIESQQLDKSGTGVEQQTSSAAVHTKLQDVSHDPLTNNLTAGEGSTVKKREDDFVFVGATDIINVYNELKQLLPAFKSLKWTDVAKQLQFDDTDMEEIRRLQKSDHDCMDHLLSIYFSSEDTSLHSIYSLADVVSTLGKESLAQQIRIKASELKQSCFGKHHQESTMVIPRPAHLRATDLSPTEKWSQDWDENDTMGMLMHPRPNPNLTGKQLKKRVGSCRMRGDKAFSTPLKKCLKLKFHALIPMTTWGWDSASTVFVRFRNVDLGKWQWDCGRFKEKQKRQPTLAAGKSELSDETFVEVEGVFFIPMSLINSGEGIQYKYVVYSSKVKQDSAKGSYWEYLPHTSGKVVNRYLVIPDRLKQVQETFVQYDSVILPPVNESIQERIPLIGRLWKKSTATPKLRFDIALNFYFADYLQSFLKPSVNVLDLQCSEELVHIFQQLYSCWQCTDYETFVDTPADLNGAVEWIDSLLEKLLMMDHTHVSKVQKFCVGTVLVQFVSSARILHRIPIPSIRNLLKLLAPSILWSQDGGLRCPEFFDVLEIKSISLSLERTLPVLCTTLIEHKEVSFEWLYGVVLLHYLQKSIVPFQPIDLSSVGQLQVGTFWYKVYAGLSLSQYHGKVSLNKKYTEEAFTICQKYFQLDQLLIWTFVAICPKENFIWLLQQYQSAAPVIIEVLHLVLHTQINTKECTFLTNLLNQLAVKVRMQSPPLFTDVQYSSIVHSSINLMQHLRPHCSRDKHHVSVIAAILGVYLVANAGWILTSRTASCANQGNSGVESKVIEIPQIGWGGMKQELITWFESSVVIGGSRFGRDGSTLLANEVKIWTVLTSIECPSVLTELWERLTLMEILDQRVDKLPPDMKLRLLNQQPILPEFVLRSVSKSVLGNIKEGSVEGEKFEDILFALFDTKHQSACYSESVLGAHLQQQFGDNNKLTLELLLLRWRLWSKYLQEYCKEVPSQKDLETISKQIGTKWMQLATVLKLDNEAIGDKSSDPAVSCLTFLKTWLLGSDFTPKTWHSLHTKLQLARIKCTSFVPKLKQGVGAKFGSEAAEVLCESAVQLFREISHKIADNTVTIAEMKLIKEVTDSVHSTHLLNAPKAFTIFEELYEKVSTRGDRFLPLKDKLLLAIDARMAEYEEFCYKKSTLSTFQEDFSDIAPGECAKLKGMVGLSEQKEMLHDVCQRADLESPLQYVFPCFEVTKEIDTMLDEFYILAISKHTKIFIKLQPRFMSLPKTDDGEKSTVSLTLDEICLKVWKPLYNECEGIINGLATTTIQLDRVRDLFGQMDPSEIYNQTKELTDALNACRKLRKADLLPEPSATSLHKVHLYNQLCDSKEAGRVLNRLRKTIGLTLTDIAESEKQVDIRTDMELSVIDESFFQVELEILKEIAEQPSRRRCIEAFCDHYKLVEWIKKETKSLAQLQHLVQLITRSGSAEGDDVNDLLVDLVTVASAFGSFIYDPIAVDASNEELSKRCKQIWDALAKTPNMSLVMESCGRQLQSFKYFSSISSGDIKQNTLTQMEQINANGIYQVGTKDGCPITSAERAVCVTVVGRGTKRDVIQLKELQELHGKLVLIGGSKGENVTRFLEILHHIQQIAELLVALQKNGYTKYINFMLKFGCANVELSNLEDLNDQMSRDFGKWEKRVRKCRDEYYCLNYYTTEQLLYIREELGAIKRDQTSEPTMKLISLLQSVSPNVDTKKIIQSLENVTKNELLSIRTDTQQGRSKGTRKPEVLMAKQRVSRLTEYQRQLCSDLEEDGFKVGLIMKGLSTIDLDTAESSEQQLLNWCESQSIHKQQMEANKTDLNLYQQQLLDTLASKGYDQELVISGMQALSIIKDPEEVLRKWCEANENAFVQDNSDSEESSDDLDYDDYTVSDEIPVDENHPLVKALLDEYSLQVAIKAVKMAGIDADIDSVDSIAAQLDLGYVPQKAESDSKWTTPARYRGTQFTVEFDPNIEEQYLALELVGEFFKELSHDGIKISKVNLFRGPVETPRPSKGHEIRQGSPNFIVADQASVWKTLLSIYAYHKSSCLPTFEEVLVCTRETTVEEVTLLWKRAVKDPGNKRIFCLCHAEKLPYSICDRALQDLESETQGYSDYRIVIICTKFQHDWSHIILSRLAPYRRTITLLDDSDLAQYLQHNFSLSERILKLSAVQSPPKDKMSSVCLVTSSWPGMGKTLYAQRLAQIFDNKNGTNDAIQHVPIHGPSVSASHVIPLLTKSDFMAQTLQVLHIDVAHSILADADSLLFNIAILGGLVDSHGTVWRHQLTQLIIIECTLSEVDVNNDVWTKRSEGSLSSCEMLLSLLPTKYCCTPLSALAVYNKERSQRCNEVLMDSEVQRQDNFQRVFQYIRRHSAGVDLNHFVYQNESPEGDVETTLPLLIRQLETGRNPSWSEISHFVEFLSTQLQDCEESIYCTANLTEDVLPKFKEFVVKFMLQMSEEFTAPSLMIAQAHDEGFDDGRIEKEYTFSEQHKWLSRTHPYMFFNDDKCSMTFLGFSINPEGHLIRLDTKEIIHRDIITKELRTGLCRQQVEFSENYEQWDTDEMLGKLASVVGCKRKDDTYINPDRSYVLTYDNLMKMVAIHMRFRCNIPVIMMGETGCGKTRLLRYLCDLQAKTHNTDCLICLKVYGGTTREHILDAVQKAQKLALHNEQREKPVHTVLFFDEVNTTESLELIKEVMCDRRMNGNRITENVKFAAACNPYRKHSEEMLKKLTAAGLGFYDSSRIETIGTIKPYELVYRVRRLPPSMLPLVYDFGQISGETENKYIKQIVSGHVIQINELNDPEGVSKAVCKVLSECQRFMRDQKDECSFVSLRDVIRALIVFEWFLDKLHNLEVLRESLRQEEQNEQPLNSEAKALICAVSVCYHARLDSRSGFEVTIVQQFEGPCAIFGDDKVKRFQDEIYRYQNVFLKAMVKPEDMYIAHNGALRENIFMMVVCIENRLPLFLVGKPGSSKSLAKTIVMNSMQGKQSQSELLRSFKQVQVFPYQCSQYSTSRSIIEVFEEAKKYQSKTQLSQFVSVVVLEEVGLAEASPGLPLKTLHPYLEDGTSGLSHDKMEIEREKRVAFIGISNWALDPAKMNRGIMVSRIPPDNNELLKTANGIANSVTDVQIRESLKKYFFQTLAKMYKTVCKQAQRQAISHSHQGRSTLKREFFGLRDFYSLIKMVCYFCITSNALPTWEHLEHAVRRNFSGMLGVDPISCYKITGDDEDSWDWEGVKEHCSNDCDAHRPSCTPLGLIEASITTFVEQHPTKSTAVTLERCIKDYQENRFLLFITENNSALQILETRLLVNKSPFILYGSSFPKDHEYTQVCRNINQIKIHMETGKPVVLLNLESIYESLYDLLNQCYTVLPRGRYVDLGLQTHRIKCKVHHDFRLIIVAEHSKVFTSFPSALINRLEKHYVLSSTILNEEQVKVAASLQTWTKKFSSATAMHSEESFTEADAFIGFQSDTIASVVLHSTELISKSVQVDEELDLEKVELLSQELLLQLSCHDALARLCYTPLGKDKEKLEYTTSIYFEKQKHTSLTQFLKHYIHNVDCAKQICSYDVEKGGLFQITTFSALLSKAAEKSIAQEMGMGDSDVQLLMLQEYDTEMEFSRKLRNFFKKCSTTQRLLVIQCGSGHQNSDLIACARYRVIDERKKEDTNGLNHVVFVIQLPRICGGTPFASFQGGQWISTHIDDLNGSDGTIAAMRFALKESVSSLYRALLSKELPLTKEFDPVHFIHGSIHKAVSELISDQFMDRAENIVQILLVLIPDYSVVDNNEENISARFSNAICNRVSKLLEEKSTLGSLDPKEWAVKQAMSAEKLQRSCTLVGAVSSAVFEVVKEMLLYVITRMDLNYNLDILYSETSESASLPTALSNMWLSVFENERLLHLRYTQLGECKKSSMNLHYNYKFKCCFPFSVEIVAEIESALVTILPEGQRVKSDSYRELCDLLHEHAIREVFENVPNEVKLDFQQRYINDFLLIKVQGVHTVLKLLSKSLNHSIGVLRGGRQTTFLDEVAAIHLAYRNVELQFYWFMQVSFLFPELVSKFEDIPPEDSMIIHWKALSIVLNCLSPQETQMTTEEQRKKWISQVQVSKNVVDSIVSCKPSRHTGADILTDIRRLWLRIQTIHLFMQHVVIHLPHDHPKVDVLPKRMFRTLRGTSIRFSEKSVLDEIIRYIKIIADQYRKLKHIPSLLCVHCNQRSSIDTIIVFPCSKKHLLCEGCYDKLPFDDRKCPKCGESKVLSMKPYLPDEEREKLLDYKHLQQRCRNFFMEFISRVCFGPDTPEPPAESFIEMLTKIAVNMGDSAEFEELFPIEEEQFSFEKCKVIRSFLIQLLLEHSPEHAKNNLQDFMQHVQREVGQQFIRDDMQLYLLCVKSMERSYFRQYFQYQSLTDQIVLVTKVLETAKMLHCDSSWVEEHRPVMDMEYMESVAQIRFALSVTADVCFEYFFDLQGYSSLPYKEKVALEQLVSRAEELCEKALIIGHLKHFMIKQIVKCHGFSCWLKVSQSDPFKWAIPSKLDSSSESTDQTSVSVSAIDPFTLYGAPYLELRKYFAYSSDSLQHCINEAKIIKGDAPDVVLYALFKHHVMQVPNNSSSHDEVLNVILQMKHSLKKHQIFNEDISSILLHGFSKESVSLPELEFSPKEKRKQRHLVEIVVHVAGVLAHTYQDKLLEVLRLPLVNPNLIQTLYLPTMPEAVFDDAIKALGLAPWECPNGHKYFIGNCGRPWVKKKCPVEGCNAEIGGRHHSKEGGNQRLNEKVLASKATKLGHILGAPHKRWYSGPDSARERYLSGQACMIIRLILHSAYFWTLVGCDDEVATAVMKTLTPTAEVKHLLNFFWQHMEKDLHLLSCEIHHNQGDAALLVHLVLQSVMSSHGHTAVELSLDKEEDRTEWERTFKERYINPILSDIEGQLNSTQQQLMVENSEGLDDLFRIVSEKDIKENIDDIHVQLWAYHSRISPQHVTSTLSKGSDDSFKFLKDFLKKEYILQSVKFLPDIVQLLKSLDEICNYRLDEDYAKKTSMSKFSHDLVPIEHKRKGFDTRVESFCKAWNIVRSQLPHRVPSEYKKQKLSEESPLVYFIPHAQGPGVCSIELVIFLATLQNETIEESWTTSDQYGTSVRDYSLQLSALQKCHVIDHKEHLEQVIISHCSYSLMAGFGAEIEYDFPSMEKHMLDLFVLGKPLIDGAAIPAIAYRGDAVHTNTFQKVRDNIAQVSLTQQQKDEIIAEHKTPHQIQDAIDVVKIALGFLTCSKWTKCGQLCRYVQAVLKLDYQFTPKVERYCTVGHALSLWKTLCVEQARHLRDPFSDIDSVFKEKLLDDEKQSLNDCLMKINAANFLECMYEFIITYVQTKRESDYLHEMEIEEVIELSGIPFKLDQVEDHGGFLPEGLLLSKVIDVWEHASIYYQEKQK